ncbi:DUF1120 domain-containing protein [Herbaspirillum lusitanum]|uniref:DUF1120 domain-containing protein n=1 Tax=Herbaspirillum lusitanum TaxID=213312 RepID=A0ABW9AII5_9BURK
MPAIAANTAPMEVVSTITPAACTPSLSGGGVADYGTMSADILKPGRITALETRSLSFTISCDAAAKISIRMIDNRAGSLVNGIVASGSGNGSLGDDFNFGLGSASGKNIGGYLIKLQPGSYTGDYRSAQLMSSADGGTSWQAWNSGEVAKGRSFSWSSGSSNSVDAYQNIAGVLNIQPYLNKPENLSLSQEIVLDGSATIELNYL